MNLNLSFAPSPSTNQDNQTAHVTAQATEEVTSVLARLEAMDLTRLESINPNTAA
eukprot:CAMPEP_0119528020 /NCGR_PEP_ID=MMETSP1344-20130328/42305_1 /TAXON_ID=236787 /ORGANISM="Florenciella parvula, Strain CCMP2471" /LENGTH=54 /DNA_ID=CAMNT_0007567319 /DNA_START=41 /DNA_END=201 /DNA_ORIENTATION=-